jgi:ABC-type transporter Mla subunit MlaD
MPSGVRQGRRIAIGAALIVGLIAAAILIFYLEAILRSSRDTYSIVGIFFETPRLRIGSTVRIAGYPVGEVTRIELLPPDGDTIPPFAATLRVPVRLRTELRRDSRIRLQRLRFMGEPVVELTPGTIAAPILQQGDTLRAQPPIRTATLVEMAGALQSAIDSLLADEAVLRRRAESLAPLAARLRSDLAGARAEFQAFERQLRAGPLPDFLEDTTWRRTLRELAARATEIETLARARVATFSDTLQRPALESLARRAGALRAEIDALRALLESPLGFPRRWEEDPALRNAIEATLARLDSLIEISRRKPWRYFF